MNKLALGVIIVLVVIVLGVVAFEINKNGNAMGAASSSSSNGTIKLADSQYANNAYLISDETLDSNAQVYREVVLH